MFTVHHTETETLVLLRKRIGASKCKVMDLSHTSRSFEWISTLQNLIKMNDENIIIYAQDDQFTGILGFMNCLRVEQSGSRFRCVFIKDKNAPKFDPQLDFYKKQLNKGMIINVYENNTWGTYRHLLLDEINYVEKEWCYVNSTMLGDLNSLCWMQIDRQENINDSIVVDVSLSRLC